MEVKSSSPSLLFLHFFFIRQPSIDSLPSPSLRSPSLSTLPSSYLPLLRPFPVPSVVLYIPFSLSTFLNPLEPSPFHPNLPRPYFFSSLPISFPTFLLYCLSTSLPSPFLPFPSFPFFRCYPSHFPLLLSSPFLFIFLLLLSPFLFLFPFPSLPILLGLWFFLLLPQGGKKIFIHPVEFIRFYVKRQRKV